MLSVVYDDYVDYFIQMMQGNISLHFFFADDYHIYEEIKNPGTVNMATSSIYETIMFISY